MSKKPEYKIVSERSQFFMIPNKVDDLGLDVYAFRLYCRIKRVAGEDGLCWQSTGTLAEACEMSAGSVSKAKDILVQRGLIQIIKMKNPNGGYDYDQITIRDIWSSSPHELTSSPHELTSSPGETKNTTLRKPQEEEREVVDSRNLEPGETSIIKLYQNTIGLVNPTILPFLLEAEERYPIEWLIEAFTEAGKQNARNWKYVEVILQSWEKNGFKADTRYKKGNKSGTSQAVEVGDWR